MKPLRYEPINSQEDQPNDPQMQQLTHRNTNKLLQIFVIILLAGVCIKMFYYGPKANGGVIHHPASNSNKITNGNSQSKILASVHQKYQTQSDM